MEILTNNKLSFNFLNLTDNDSELRIKRSNDKTLVEATLQRDYTYWLSQEDIADIARIQYNNFVGSEESNTYFEILGSLPQLYITSELFQLKIQAHQLNTARLCLIINLNNLHWVSLVIVYQHDNYIGYYIDSNNQPIPSQYYRMLFDDFKIQPRSLSPGFSQQTDAYNCGIWALQNTELLNRMLDQNKDVVWIIGELKQKYNLEHFNLRREIFTEALYRDDDWRRRHSLDLALFQKNSRKLSTTSSNNDQLSSKKLKTTAVEQKKIDELLEAFVESFLSAFIKKISLYHLLSKGESLTEDAIKTELKTGITGALLGVSIASSLVGSIPSLVASLRSISSKFFLYKSKAQKITRIFSEYKPNNLRLILSEVAVNIFYSFESQFMQVTDKAGDKMALEKLAEDAIARLFNGIIDLFSGKELITNELIEKSILHGPSENFLNPNVKRAQLTIPGYAIQNKNGIKINTGKLYEKIGIIEFSANGQPRKFYALKNYPINKYGYRRPFNWEKNRDCTLNEFFKKNYFEKEYFQVEEATQIISKNYDYYLDGKQNDKTAKHILNKIENEILSKIPSKEVQTKRPIFFELRKPVKNFSGRTAILEQLHSTLMSEMTTAIVPAWSSLSISSSLSSRDAQSSRPSSGSQLSIIGLGGIGKTQLALRYAEIYAEYYDHNVIWIDSETKENLHYSFEKLAKKLNIPIKDDFGLKKTLEEIVEEVYEYFSDRKSLFIFDNVENYRTLEAYFPKARPGNKPTVLITSRYTNWSNIATIIPLQVFTEFETIEFIKKSLGLNDIQNSAMKELNQLLQGFPLALQQAIAYIKLRQHTNFNFSIRDYIQLFKIKEKELLCFNYFDYSNDYYFKTVFTTWQVTLDKIKTEKLGKNALDILNILAYLYPDYLPKSKLYYLTMIYEKFELSDIDKIIHLLTSYSMITLKDETSYMIHRLTQQTLRVNIESNPELFQHVVAETQLLIWHWNRVYKNNKDTLFHYMHFSLYMSEHKDFIDRLVHGHPEKNFFDSLRLQNIEHSQYFLDLAYLKFPKNKFLTFIGKGIAYYTKLGYFFHLHQIISYLITQLNKKNISRENIKYMMQYINNLQNPIFKLKRYSTLEERKNNQHSSVRLYYEFVAFVFGRRLDLYNTCASHSQKRSLCLSEEERNKLKEFTHQQIKSHFEKIGQVSRYISSALMTKDILSAFVHGDFDEVAVNLGLIISSTFFGKISNSLLTQGKKLASGANTLEKDLNLASKKVLNILWNEEIVSAGKRKFFGKLMQTTSPFVARIPSIVLFINLYNEKQAYQMGDTTLLPNIISNSIILSVDGLEATIESAEFFNIIVGISAFTGPIGEWIALSAWIGSEVYIANQHTKAIEKYVQLTRGEKFWEFLLSLLHQAPLEYIQLKANNGLRIEKAINFLKNNTDIKWYFFPSAAFSEDLCNVRKVFLDKEMTFALDNSNPDKPTDGDLVCLAAAPPYNVSALNFFDKAIARLSTLNDKIIKSYVCHKTLGVSYNINRTDNMSFVSLGEGDDEVVAFSHSPTSFLLQNGKKQYLGGESGNVFELSGHAITGKLQGGKESDILYLKNFHPKNIDYVLLDSAGSICGKKDGLIEHVPLLCPDENKLQIEKIEQIYGRKNEAEIFYLNRAIEFIDGYGGKNLSYPDIFFITEQSNKDLKFVLRNNTFINISLNAASNRIEYSIPLGETGETHIQCSFNQSMQHRLFFQYSLFAINNILTDNNSLSLSVRAPNTEKTFLITLLNPINNQTENTFPKEVYYCFCDIEVKLINKDYLYGREIKTNNKTVDEKINLFSILAHRLEKSFSIQLINNTTLSIGKENKHEIFYISSLNENHLIDNGGENVYIILPTNETTFPLPKIILYDTLARDSDELRNTLDLREIIKKYKKIYPDAIIASHIFRESDDLILTLSNAVYAPFHDDHYNLACFSPWLRVQLKKTLLNDSNAYQKMDILLDDAIPKNIVALEDDVWELKTAPIFFFDDKKIIYITQQDITEQSTFIFLKNIARFAFFRDKNNLILTNALESTINYCTIIFYQFYENPEMKEKLLSSTFEFFDRTIQLKNYQKQIDHATHFQHLAELFLGNVTESKAMALLNTFYIIPPVDEVKQAPLLSKSSRRKRHVYMEEKPTADSNFFPKQTATSQLTEHDRILAIADDYLEKYDHAKTKNKSYKNKKNSSKKSTKKVKTTSPVSLQKSDKPVIEQKIKYYLKNNESYFKYDKANPLSQKKLTLPKKLKEKNHALRFNSNSPMSNKEIFFKDNRFNPKINFSIEKKLKHQENFILAENKTLAHFRLSYKKNQSNSKKPNLPRSSYALEHQNFHHTLMFIDFIIRKSVKNPIQRIDSNQKLNKLIKKGQRQHDKIKTGVFGVKNNKL